MKALRRLSILLVLAAALSTFAAAQSKPPSAQSVLAAAVQTAKAQQKNVLIHFGASWCSWCKRLDEMLESKEVGKLFQDNYVIAHLTIQEHQDKVALENPNAQQMADSAGAGGAGVPVYIFFDGNGKQLATSLALPDGGNIGYPATPEEIKAFDTLLLKTAPRMTGEQRKQVSDYLSNQKH